MDFIRYYHRFQHKLTDTVGTHQGGIASLTVTTEPERKVIYVHNLMSGELQFDAFENILDVYMIIEP